MSIYNEVQQMEHLTVIGKSLISYAMSIEPGLVFERNAVGWIPNDERNFIGFRFQWTDSLSITISLYGAPEEHFVQDDLPIKKGKCNNSLCRVTDDYQLMAATVSIWRAHQLFHRGCGRDIGALLLVDEKKSIRQGKKNWLRPRPDETELLDQTNPHLADASEWYNEVKVFMKENKLIDTSILS